ncbi:hypothetical protein H6P81_000584 [Aristolochia fimbriata]|uniref:Uncharacterized protein n=1 Tax=Aristolochia fimbriata TaxID=158543 RepID=A0AAV7F8C9_ARIFI|nr:hypothetical protein H6P81_000584 [Aristolochia fimbriata]
MNAAESGLTGMPPLVLLLQMDWIRKPEEATRQLVNGPRDPPETTINSVGVAVWDTLSSFYLVCGVRCGNGRMGKGKANYLSRETVAAPLSFSSERETPPAGHRTASGFSTFVTRNWD